MDVEQEVVSKMSLPEVSEMWLLRGSKKVCGQSRGESDVIKTAQTRNSQWSAIELIKNIYAGGYRSQKPIKQ